MKATSTIIELRNIVKNYHSGHAVETALNGVSMSIGQGEFVALMGQSGAGKTTLLNIIGMLDQPTSGTFKLNAVEVNFRDISRLQHLRAQHFGFVFQSANLLQHQSVLENTMLPLLYRGIKEQEATKIAFETLKNLAIQKLHQKKPSELSSGQLQRVSIACAVVHQPDIIIADEPTGSLDSKTSNEVMQVFQDLHHNGKTIIMATHSKRVAAFADRTVYLHDGKKVRSSHV